jgi:hypothetical protein
VRDLKRELSRIARAPLASAADRPQSRHAREKVWMSLAAAAALARHVAGAYPLACVEKRANGDAYQKYLEARFRFLAGLGSKGDLVMPRMIRLIWLVALVLLSVTACGKSSALSPTLPSDPSANFPGAAATGATIAGTVNVNLGGSGLLPTQAAGSRLTVAVAGTSLSSLVDDSRHFELKGVPRGTIQLRFTGVGIDASIVIIGVTESERIQIAVAVSGATATLVTIERTHSASSEVELKGAVSSISGTCPTPTFVVNGTTVTTTTSTQFKDGSCDSLAVGRQVEVRGTRQADGTVLASRVEIKEKE